MKFSLTETVSILMVDYPYTLKLTAPITVVINGNINTGGKVLFGATISLRATNEVSAIILSGANAIAGNRPTIASVIAIRGVSRARLLGATITLRGSDRRPLTGTVMICTGSERVVNSTIARFGTMANGKLATGINSRDICNNGCECVSRFTRVSSSRGTGTRRLTRRNGAPLCFYGKGGFLNVVTITSVVGRSNGRTIGRLGGVNIHIMVLANSGRGATGTITGGTSVSRIITKILPRNGRGGMGRLGGCNGITVINSNVGSTPTLADTSLNVTVKTKASITVSTTSIMLMGDHLTSIPTAVELNETALHGVRRGLF